MSDNQTVEIEEEFDLDNLYDGIDGNSANPIAPGVEHMEEDTSCPGGACKL